MAQETGKPIDNGDRRLHTMVQYQEDKDVLGWKKPTTIQTRSGIRVELIVQGIVRTPLPLGHLGCGM